MQILLFLGIAAASMTIISVIGTLLIPPITGLSLAEMTDSSSWKAGDQRVVTMLRIMMLVQFLGLFVIPSLVFAYLSDRSPSQYLGLRKPWNPTYWLIGLAILLVAIPLVELTGRLNREIPFDAGTLKWITDMEEKAGQTLKLLLGGTSVSELILNIIFIAVFAAVGEELVFRGVLQRIFIKGFRSPWAGIVFTAFLFSFFHMQFFGFIPRFFLGILLSRPRRRVPARAAARRPRGGRQRPGADRAGVGGARDRSLRVPVRDDAAARRGPLDRRLGRERRPSEAQGRPAAPRHHPRAGAARRHPRR